MAEVDGEDTVGGVDGVDTAGDGGPLKGDAGLGELGAKGRAGDADGWGLPCGDVPGVGAGGAGGGEAARWSRGASGCWARALASGAEAEGAGGRAAWGMQGGGRSTSAGGDEGAAGSTSSRSCRRAHLPIPAPWLDNKAGECAASTN